MKLNCKKKKVGHFYVVILPGGESTDRLVTLQEAGIYAQKYNDLMAGTGNQAVIAQSAPPSDKISRPALSKFRRHLPSL